MNGLPKISVIMPSLNVAKYIRECMDSVVSQSLKDIEILAVDAGSTDGTLEILREYDARDSRVKVILSDKKSYGYQMNLGLNAATGDYIGILETDDMLLPHALEMLFARAEKYECDYAKGYTYSFIQFPNQSCYRLADDRVWGDMPEEEKLVFPSQTPELLLKEFHIWTGIYRKEFIQNIHFTETAGAAFQDIGFLVRTHSLAKRAVYVNIPVYRYRRTNEASSIYNPKSFLFLLNEYRLLYNDFSSDKTNRWKACFYLRMFRQILTRFVIMAVFEKYWPDTEKSIAGLQDMLKEAYASGYIDSHIWDVNARLLLKLFLCDPESVYEFYTEEFQPKLQNLKSILSWAKERPVIIWGCGKWGKFTHALLMRNGVSAVEAYVDSNPALWGTTVQGEEVLSPEEAATRFPDAYYLIANKKNGGEIQARLLQNGISEDRICCPKTIDTDLWLLARPLI